MNNTEKYLIEPHPDLGEKILERIKKYEKIAEFKRNVFGFLLGAISFSSIVYFFVMIVQQFSHSGFYDYFSLIFTDSKLVFSNLGDYSLTILDTIPYFEITITLAFIITALLSLKFMFGRRKEFNGYAIN